MRTVLLAFIASSVVSSVLSSSLVDSFSSWDHLVDSINTWDVAYKLNYGRRLGEDIAATCRTTPTAGCCSSIGTLSQAMMNCRIPNANSTTSMLDTFCSGCYGNIKSAIAGAPQTGVFCDNIAALGAMLGGMCAKSSTGAFCLRSIAVASPNFGASTGTGVSGTAPAPDATALTAFCDPTCKAVIIPLFKRAMQMTTTANTGTGTTTASVDNMEEGLLGKLSFMCLKDGAMDFCPIALDKVQRTLNETDKFRPQALPKTYMCGVCGRAMVRQFMKDAKARGVSNEELAKINIRFQYGCGKFGQSYCADLYENAQAMQIGGQIRMHCGGLFSTGMCSQNCSNAINSAITNYGCCLSGYLRLSSFFYNRDVLGKVISACGSKVNTVPEVCKSAATTTVTTTLNNLKFSYYTGDKLMQLKNAIISDLANFTGLGEEYVAVSNVQAGSVVVTTTVSSYDDTTTAAVGTYASSASTDGTISLSSTTGVISESGSAGLENSNLGFTSGTAFTPPPPPPSASSTVSFAVTLVGLVVASVAYLM